MAQQFDDTALITIVLLVHKLSLKMNFLLKEMLIFFPTDKLSTVRKHVDLFVLYVSKLDSTTLNINILPRNRLFCDAFMAIYTFYVGTRYHNMLKTRIYGRVMFLFGASKC